MTGKPPGSLLQALVRNTKLTGKIWTRERPQPLPFLYTPLSPRHTEDFYRAFGAELVRDNVPAWIIVNAYSLGDTYLVASLAERFREAHCADGKKLVLVVKSSVFDAAMMFRQHVDRIIALDDLYVNSVRLELEHMKLPTHLRPNHAYFPHPNHLVDERADLAASFAHVSQFNMYAILLRVAGTTQPSSPEISEAAREGASKLCTTLGIRRGRTVLLFPDANSWTSVPDQLWERVVPALKASGWDVFTNGSGTWRGPRTEAIAGSELINVPLDVVLPFVEQAGWAVGTLCGMMNVIVTSRTKCRKTIVTRGMAPGMEEEFYRPTGAPWTYPHAYQRTYDGFNYDIEELQVLGTAEAEYDTVAKRIGRGFNALSDSPPSPDPVVRLPVDIVPGELFDKISILEIKRDQLPDEKRVQVEKELAVLREIARPLLAKQPELASRYEELKQLNILGWTLNERIFKEFDDTDYGSESWTLDPSNAADLAAAQASVQRFRRSQQANRDRVRVKNEINALSRAAWDEKKSFDLGRLRL